MKLSRCLCLLLAGSVLAESPIVPRGGGPAFFCRQGANRSGMMAVVYVSVFNQATIAEAYAEVQRRRPIVYLEGKWQGDATLLATATGFEPQLQALGVEWVSHYEVPRRRGARMALTAAPPSHPPPAQDPNLRQIVGAKWVGSTQECAGGQCRSRRFCGALALECKFSGIVCACWAICGWRGQSSSVPSKTKAFN